MMCLGCGCSLLGPLVILVFASQGILQTLLSLPRGFATAPRVEAIVFAGTKLNIDYYLEDLFDEDQMEELYDYFIESESDSIEEALDEFEGDYEEEELRLYRIKFMSEIAN